MPARGGCGAQQRLVVERPHMWQIEGSATGTISIAFMDSIGKLWGEE